MFEVTCLCWTQICGRGRNDDGIRGRRRKWNINTKEQTQTCFLLLSHLFSKSSGKRVCVRDIIRVSVRIFPSLITTGHIFNSPPNSLHPDGSELNFNNMYFKDKASRAYVPMEGNKCSAFFFISRYNIVTMWHTFWMLHCGEMLSVMLWLCVTESVTRVWRVTWQGMFSWHNEWPVTLGEVTLVTSQTLWIVPDREKQGAHLRFESTYRDNCGMTD